jgi:hypothetical protein
VKAFGESNTVPQRTLKALTNLYTDWRKPAQVASYTARLTPAKPPDDGKQR